MGTKADIKSALTGARVKNTKLTKKKEKYLNQIKLTAINIICRLKVS